MTTDAKRPAHRRTFRIAAVAGAAVVAIVVAELGLRIALGGRFVSAPPARRAEDVIGRHDPDLGWTLAPGARTRIYGEGFAYDVATNSRGYRDAERGSRPRPGTRRVALLGDSYGFGMGVAAAETMGALLERDPRVAAEVVNLCVPGYSTDQELWTLEREGPRLAPDVVLVLFCPNDLDGNETTNSHRMIKPCFVRGKAGEWRIKNRPAAAILPVGRASTSWSERAFSRFAIWQVATGRASLARQAAPPVPAAVSGAPSRADVDRFGRDTPTRHAFEMLAAESRKLGAKLVVVGVPTIGLPEAPPAPGRDAEFLYPTTRGLAALGADVGFETLSVDRALRDAWAAGRTVVVPDGHWNAEGHRLAAEALAPRLAEILHARR